MGGVPARAGAGRVARGAGRRGGVPSRGKARTARRSWGDELTLQGCADAFGVVVHVVAAHDVNWHLFYEPAAGARAGRRLLFLSYLHPVHYNILTDEPPSDPASPLL